MAEITTAALLQPGSIAKKTNVKGLTSLSVNRNQLARQKAQKAYRLTRITASVASSVFGYQPPTMSTVPQRAAESVTESYCSRWRDGPFVTARPRTLSSERSPTLCLDDESSEIWSSPPPSSMEGRGCNTWIQGVCHERMPCHSAAVRTPLAALVVNGSQIA